MGLVTEFKPGTRFAVTRSKHTGDRSYIQTVWEVVDSNCIDIKAKPLSGKVFGWSKMDFVYFAKDEYDFYEVGNLDYSDVAGAVK